MKSIVVSAVILISGVATGATGQGLLEPAPEAGPDVFRPGVVRSRPVRVVLSRLPGATPGEAARGVLPRTGHTLTLDLFDDVAVKARMTSAKALPRGLAWRGRVEGEPLGSVVLVVVDGVLAGSVVLPDAAYSIRSVDGGQVVEEVDRSVFPDDPDCAQEAPEVLDVPAGDRQGIADDGSTVDVLVAYTPAARAAAGGTTAMEARIQLGITETNQAYADSQVTQRLRLVGTTEVAYTESGSPSTDLNRLTFTDGFMDGVFALRDSTRADMVSLIVNGYGTTVGCGVAWLMGPTNWPGFESRAFSVVDELCISPNYTFGHELGHNMGLNHARVDPVGTGAFPYSFGYKDPASVFRTVMSYNCPVNCPRVLHFSNPNVTYSGGTTGIIDTAPNSAFNAKSLNNTALAVSNWRESTICAPVAIDPWALPIAIAGTAYSQQFTQTGATGAVTWSQTGALPSGVTFDPATATLAGTPGSTGDFPITVTVADATACPGASRDYILAVASAASSTWGAVSLDVDAAGNRVLEPGEVASVPHRFPWGFR